MADRKPLAHYGALMARSLAACSAELHHYSGRDHAMAIRHVIFLSEVLLTGVKEAGIALMRTEWRITLR
jgi:hypothetical protein